MTTIADREDLIWLAGLLEGEGTFDLHRARYPRVRVGMTDRDVVGRAASLMGCSVRSTLRAAPFKSTWHAEISGDRAQTLMRQILPHMGSRRSQRIADVLGARAKIESPSRYGVPGPSLSQPPGHLKAA